MDRLPVVCAVTVTYASRASLCEAATTAALSNGASTAIVIDNDSVPASAAQLRQMAASSEGRVHVRRCEENLGSAGGFSLGARIALEDPSVEFVWFLDDDNVAQPGALRALLSAVQDLSVGEAARQPAVLSYRPARPYQVALIERGLSPRAVYPSPGGYANFHVGDLPRKVARRLSKRAGGAFAGTAVEIPYGPYGGLLAPRSALEQSGLPDVDYFVYEDDAEFTSRLREHGTRLFLVPSSVVEDMDGKWYDAGSGRTSFGRLLNVDSAGRAFYTLRNRVAFEEAHWRGRPRLRRLNRWLFRVGLWSTAATSRRRERYLLLKRALDDAEAGRMGRLSVKL